MIFLSLISDWLSKAGDAVEGTIMKAIRTLFFSLDTLIYRLIIDLYDMFESLCSARLLTDTTLKNISDRIGLILGIIMLFYVVLGFIQMLIDPDKINDKEKGAASIVKKVIIVIVMLGVSNFVFNTLYDIQSTVVQSHVISRLLLPYSIEVKVGDNENDKTSNTQSIMDNKKFGAILSEELFHTFYHLEDLDKDSKMTNSDTVAYTDCEKAVNAFRLQIVNYKRFEIGYRCLNESIKVQYKIEEKDANTTYSEAEEINVVYFNWLFSVICGVAVAYLMVMYCFKVGVRMIQLMFLEVISPMAFVSYLSPKKDSMFNKWTKLYISTYIDVFIRIAIINFVFFIIATLFSNNGSLAGLDFWTNMNITDTTSYTKGFYIVIIILALLTFAHKAPDLLKDLFGTSDSKLGFGASMKDIVGLKKGVGIGTSIIGGAAGGAAVGLIGGGFGGFAGGLLKGGFSGFKGQGIRKTATSAWKSQATANKKMADIRANGGSWMGYHLASLQKNMGIRTAADTDKKVVDDINNYIKYQDEIEGYAKNNSVVKRLERDYEAIKQGGRMRGESDERYTTRMEVARQNWKRAMEATINSSMTGSDVDYHSAELSYNTTTGHWDIVDSATVSTITNASIPTNISGSIMSKTNEMNRVGNSLGYSKATNYTDMDNNSNQAKSDIARITSDPSYARNQANDSK